MYMKWLLIRLCVGLQFMATVSYAYVPPRFVHVVRSAIDHEDFQQALRDLGKRIGKNLDFSEDQKNQFYALLQAYRELMSQHAALYHDQEACEVAEQRFYELCEQLWPEGSQEEVELEDIVDAQLSERYGSKLVMLVIDSVLKELD